MKILLAVHSAGAGFSNMLVGSRRLCVPWEQREAHIPHDMGAAAHLLSTQQMAPASCAMAASAVMSHTCMRGLVGDSTMTSAVRPGCTAAATFLHR